MKITGTIQRKGNNWYMFIRVPTEDGKTKQISKSTKIPVQGKTARETRSNERKANKLLDEYLTGLENSGRYVFVNHKFTDCMCDWLRKHKDDVRPVTFEAYEGYFNQHLLPFFSQGKYKNLAITDVTALDIEAYIDCKRAEGHKIKSIKKHLLIVNGTLERGVQLGWIDRNPYKIAKIPKSTQAEDKKTTAYSLEEARQLLEAVKGDPVEPAIMLALFLGLRKSEVLGLRWCDVDFDNNTIYIRNTVVAMRNVYEGEQTKTASSRRTLSIPPALKEFLLQLKAHQNAMRIICGENYVENPHVLRWDDGTPISRGYPYQRLQKVIKKNGLRKISFHELRHSAGSILLNSDRVNLKQIQTMLGHADIQTTMNIYGHLTDENAKRTTNILGDLLTE